MSGLPATSASPIGRSRQRRSLAQHGPSDLRAVAGRPRQPTAAASAPVSGQIALGHVAPVVVALGQVAECRLSASRRGTVTAVEAIVRPDDRGLSKLAL